MKKFTRVLALTLVTVLCASCLVACNSVKGKTYKFESMSYTYTDGDETVTQTLKVGDPIEQGSDEKVTADFMTITFNKDGSCTMSSDGDEMKGTWSQDGKKITITIDGDSATYTVDGKKLIAEVNEDGYSTKTVLSR